ncbi:uncharacterized protein IL334_006891 [Kwoniella shivajii]|uniref:DUF1772-domain-containing protein n=1 Tax=Kwoniella shivajii TaxID=564305 RepID=A0ABZ1D7M4_9TREE|nr:hypothetical protein IL334_006891 [Kwoniella shivajii]
MSTLSSALLSLPAPSVTLAIGGLTTSYVFFANVAEYQRGLIPYLNSRLTPVQLNDKGRAQLWKAYFDNAATWVVGLSLASAGLNLTTSYLHRSPLISRLTLVSGITSLLILPITVISGLLPVNARLHELAEDGGKAGTSAKEDEAKLLIIAWETKHLRRIPVYGVAWCLSALAILLDGRAY